MQPTKLVGTSPSILNLQEEIFYAAKCDAKVLITGESGAGKEIVARLIHAGSPRSRSALVTVNCAALSETLLETELFGHVRGSFTGAYRDRLGAFEQAHRGTVFMDEVGRDQPADAGSAAEISRDRRNPARRFGSGSEPGRRSRHRRDQPRSGRQRRQQDVPRGSLLPAERHSHSRAAAARSS